MADLTQQLALEVLAETLGHASVPDILRSKRVNRAFHNAIHSSPLIQHKIDLYSTGLEYNAAAGVSLADSRKALLQYRSSLDSLCPSEKWTVEDIGAMEVFRRAAGDVYAILEDSVRLFTLGSPSRGIPFKEWRIPLPVDGVCDYCFHPGADVIAFLSVNQSIGLQFEIHLRTLSGGKHHPAAQCSTIQHQVPAEMLFYIRSISISGSRFMVLADMGVNPSVEEQEPTMYLAILDWKSGRVLLELSGERYDTVEFLDDYRLLATLRSTKDPLPSLVVIDTGKYVGGIPMQTFLHLSPCRRLERPYQILERGMGNPPPPDSLVPFHHDPTQRIIALKYCSNYLIFQVGMLLKLTESRGGSEIRWDEWKNHVVVLPLGFEIIDTWVSGCRFFCVCEDIQGPKIMMRNFGPQRISEYMGEWVGRNLYTGTDPFGCGCGGLYGVGRPLLNGTGVEIPWHDLDGYYIGHDCLAFTRRHRKEDDAGEYFALHIWAFS